MQKNVTRYEAELLDLLRNPANGMMVVRALERTLKGLPEEMTEAREAAIKMRSLVNTIAH